MEELQFGRRRKTPLVRQSEAGECGLACIAMIAAHHRLELSLTALRRRFQTSLKGATLSQLMSVGEDLGFSTRALRGEVTDLVDIALPAILHWDLNHYVVLTKVSQGSRGPQYTVLDPAAGERVLTAESVGQHFTGVILELIKSQQFQPRIKSASLRLHQLWGKIEGFWSAFGHVLLLSAILQLCTLVAPFFLQIGVDTVLPSADGSLLAALALGFGGVALVAAITGWVRTLVLLRLSSTLTYQVTVNLFRHLIRLPLPWFERRNVGDIISRFGSTRSIMDLVSQGLIAAFVDGAMAIVTLTLMIVYSPVLSLIAVVALGLTVALRLGFFSALRQANVSLITANARESTAFIETMRGVATIKAFSEEANRQRYWQRKKGAAINAEIAAGRINAGFSAGEQIVLAIERVLFVYIAIRFSIAGAFSLGMVFAIQAYRQQFLESGSRLVQQIINYRLLDMHLSRIADIALSAPETAAGSDFDERVHGVPSPARIELRNVRFRYAPNEPEILRGIAITVEPGEMVALIGPSGGGKTTLIKIMMGLLPPTSGEVIINGQPLDTYGVARWRREIGSVSQDDALFAGSLADNICMFDTEPDDARIEAAAQAACIDREIQQMPMRYQTAVGDMGSVLSGGQKQRVMIARAIYRERGALLLDEATAHLDHVSEGTVGETIRALTCTRVIIAHRQQTIERADRAFVVRGGQLYELARVEREPEHARPADVISGRGG